MKRILSLILLTGLVFTFGCTENKEAKQLLEFVKKYSPQNNNCIETRALSTCSATILDTKVMTENGVVFKNHDPGKFTNYVGVDMTTFPDIEFIMLYSRMSESGKERVLNDWLAENTVFLEYDDASGYFRNTSNNSIFSEENPYVKDLESLGADLEASNNQNLREILSFNYGLSTDRSQKVARLISQYKKLSTKRALTAKEKNFFSHELLGTDFGNAYNSISNGENFDQLLEKAAKVNGTSPEAVSTILSEIFL